MSREWTSSAAVAGSVAARVVVVDQKQDAEAVAARVVVVDQRQDAEAVAGAQVLLWSAPVTVVFQRGGTYASGWLACVGMAGDVDLWNDTGGVVTVGGVVTSIADAMTVALGAAVRTGNVAVTREGNVMSVPGTQPARELSSEKKRKRGVGTVVTVTLGPLAEIAVRAARERRPGAYFPPVREEDRSARIERKLAELGNTVAEQGNTIAEQGNTIGNLEGRVGLLEKDVRTILGALADALSVTATRHVIEYIQVAAYALFHNRQPEATRGRLGDRWRNWTGFARVVLGVKKLKDGWHGTLRSYLEIELGVHRSAAAIVTDAELYHGVSRPLHKLASGVVEGVAGLAIATVPPRFGAGAAEDAAEPSSALACMTAAFDTLRTFATAQHPGVVAETVARASTSARSSSADHPSRTPEAFANAIGWFREEFDAGRLNVHADEETLDPDAIRMLVDF
jgi:hypothetical protein